MEPTPEGAARRGEPSGDATRDGPPRFPAEAAAAADALRYYHNRAIQLLPTAWSWDGVAEDLGWGVHVEMRRGVASGRFHSLFVLRDACGQGHLSRWVAARPEAKFVVMGEAGSAGGAPRDLAKRGPAPPRERAERATEGADPCAAIRGWLAAHGIAHEVAEPFPGPEYRAAQLFLGDRLDATGAYEIERVEKGLLALQRLEAPGTALRAWCLVPLLQDDADLRAAHADGALREADPHVVLVATLFRAAAGTGGPAPLPEVRDLLRAAAVLDAGPAATAPSRLAEVGVDPATCRAIHAEVERRTAAVAG